MFTKKQEQLLEKFADINDLLFKLGITTTDSFTGEIGEYVACTHFNLKKSNRVTKAIDGVCELGKKYQVKAKVMVGNNFSYNIDKLDTSAFDYLVVVYFNKNYCPVKIVRIPAINIENNKISITLSLLNDKSVDTFEENEINIPTKYKKAINEFSKLYIELEESGIIRSRRIVGDIGEMYACKYLNLKLNDNKTEKGFDAKHTNGLTFEIKTRRVYESNRRLNKGRRLNNLHDKSADYLIVVTLDRIFKCAGMWLIPMENITNPKSARLEVVNNTVGVLNIVPSMIPWLKTGDKFIKFKIKKSISESKLINTTTKEKKESSNKKNSTNKVKSKSIVVQSPTKNSLDNIGYLSMSSCLTWIIAFLIFFYILDQLGCNGG